MKPPHLENEGAFVWKRRIDMIPLRSNTTAQKPLNVEALDIWRAIAIQTEQMSLTFSPLLDKVGRFGISITRACNRFSVKAILLNIITHSNTYPKAFEIHQSASGGFRYLTMGSRELSFKSPGLFSKKAFKSTTVRIPIQEDGFGNLYKKSPIFSKINELITH